ncbi:hypothetical protein [Actinomycetospora termitidis]|uniref:Uncharacterized protein n=1 Tax=Actinomycetospora termitidis TaxID=3053470 RepID=A0ABT7MHN5_9PSEU|nr:hypothetical protein [Actinomycetospora sp. Odt1-22]MDL5160188.1 hypothetical protein [Actinomycetospora sp. Odt1-22]
MTSELDVVVRGSALPADRVLTQMQLLVQLLGLAEDSTVRKDRRAVDRTSWGFGELGLGSVHARLVPLERAQDTTQDQLNRVPLSVVSGFEHAQRSSDLPSGWGEDLATAGRRVAADLGDDPAHGMTLTLIEEGRPVRSVTITGTAAKNLKRAVDDKRTSTGSVIGTLASINTRRNQAGLWTDLDDRRVSVAIGPVPLADFAENLGLRVLVAGALTRNAVGHVLSIWPDEITRWPRGRRRLTDSAGVARGYLADEGPVEHLERVGGWAT